MNDLGFSGHCLSVYGDHKENKNNPDMDWMREDHRLELTQLIESYVLNRAQV